MTGAVVEVVDPRVEVGAAVLVVDPGQEVGDVASSGVAHAGITRLAATSEITILGAFMVIRRSRGIVGFPVVPDAARDAGIPRHRDAARHSP
ncbi:MAG TPA: hypothetical protein VK960_07750 [Acidimicrobiia bacterium]|nr:hypothetical protein [Acidimicrobiia bacterium]